MPSGGHSGYCDCRRIQFHRSQAITAVDGIEKILKMVEMILDGCKDLDEAKAKVKELTEDQKKEKSAE